MRRNTRRWRAGQSTRAWAVTGVSAQHQQREAPERARYPDRESLRAEQHRVRKKVTCVCMERYIYTHTHIYGTRFPRQPNSLRAALEQRSCRARSGISTENTADGLGTHRCLEARRKKKKSL